MKFPQEPTTLALVAPEFYQFHLNTKILFAPGISGDFSNELEQMGIRKLMMICDPYFAENGMAQKISDGMQGAGVKILEIFSEIPPNSEMKVVQKCAAIAKKQGAEGLVALGGGSAMDTAKAANILLSLGGDLVKDYSGAQTLTKPLKPLIAIPTTAGTGSEVTMAAVIYDEAHQNKLLLTDHFLRPSLALLDPLLTLTLPPKQTAMTGMDALTHAVEAYTSLQANPVSDALAMKAIKLIRLHLLAAVRNGDDLEARSQMLVAANLAGIAFDHAQVGVVHAMAHAAGGEAHLTHGLANHIFLPFGMEYNLEVCAGRYKGIAQRLGVDTRGMDDLSGGRAAIEKIRELRKDLQEACGLPLSLKEAGVKEEQLEAIADLAMEDGTTFYNAREVVRDELLKKIKEAY